MEGLRRYLLDRSIFLIIGEATGVIQNSAVKTSRLMGQARVSLLFKLSNPHGHCGWPLGLDPLLCLSVENVIRENQWGGVDIRRGGVPVLRSNLICFGYSDGVVVGDEGKGLIEGNTIYGEAPIPGGRGLGSSPAREAGSPGSVSSW